MPAPPIQFGSSNASGLNLFYVQPPQQQGNAFANYLSNYTHTATPFVRQAYTRALDAMDPTARNQQLIQLAGMLAEMDRQAAATLRQEVESETERMGLLFKAWQTGAQIGSEEKIADLRAQTAMAQERAAMERTLAELGDPTGPTKEAMAGADNEVAGIMGAMFKAVKGGMDWESAEAQAVSAVQSVAEKYSKVADQTQLPLLRRAIDEAIEDSPVGRQLTAAAGQRGGGGAAAPLNRLLSASNGILPGAQEAFTPSPIGVGRIGGQGAVGAAQEAADVMEILQRSAQGGEVSPEEAALLQSRGLSLEAVGERLGRREDPQTAATRARIEALYDAIQGQDPLEGPLGTFFRDRPRRRRVHATSGRGERGVSEPAAEEGPTPRFPVDRARPPEPPTRGMVGPPVDPDKAFGIFEQMPGGETESPLALQKQLDGIRRAREAKPEPAPSPAEQLLVGPEQPPPAQSYDRSKTMQPGIVGRTAQGVGNLGMNMAAYLLEGVDAVHQPHDPGDQTLESWELSPERPFLSEFERRVQEEEERKLRARQRDPFRSFER